MELNAKLFIDILKKSWNTFYKNIFLWVILLTPAILPCILLNTLAWHEEIIGKFIISRTSLKTFHLLDNISYIFIFIGIWVYWLALMSALKDLLNKKSFKVRHKFLEGIRLIPSDIYLKIAAVCKILLWSLCFIFPGFYKAVLYSLAKYSLVDGGKKGIDALNESHDLLKGKFIHYLDYLLFLSAIVFFCFMFQKLMIDNIYNFFMFGNMSGVLRWIENFEIVCVGLCHVFYTLFLYNLYIKLKNKQD